MSILGISGSIRKRSYNTALLRNATECLPEHATLEIFDNSTLPLFNQDLEKDLPPVVRKLKQRIVLSDAILFATPEHNYSVPAVLKNTVEWGNRPNGENSWDRKPAGLIGASTGRMGTVRAQLQLRQILFSVEAYPLPTPEFFLSNAKDKFDENLKLTDEESRQKLRELLSSLCDWARKLRNP